MGNRSHESIFFGMRAVEECKKSRYCDNHIHRVLKSLGRVAYIISLFFSH